MKTRTALITGGARGIGRVIALTLARRGYNIVTFSRTQNEVDALRGLLEGEGAAGLVERGDVRDDAYLEDVVARSVREFGGLHVLVNNAGGGKADPILKAKVSDWDDILAVNLRAAMVLTKLCLPELVKHPDSAIINIASIAGKTGMAGTSAYCAAKFGLVGFTQSLFEEVRDFGTKVSAICPGYVDTKLIPTTKALLREEMIRPEDVAKAVEVVLDASPSACPVEITIRPQRYPFRK